MLVASVLNAVTAKSEINTVARISAVDGELFVHHGGVLPHELRTLLGPAVNAVAARSGSRGSASVSVADPVGRLERLAALHNAGKLSDDEFLAAKQKILKDFA